MTSHLGEFVFRGGSEHLHIIRFDNGERFDQVRDGEDGQARRAGDGTVTVLLGNGSGGFQTASTYPAGAAP
jgi:hypothetical protein